MRICKKCIKTENTPGITFDPTGICNYCRDYEKMERIYPISEEYLKQELEKIKKEHKESEYDCIVGVSGGCDSSFMLDMLVGYGMRCLAVHWDNNWNTKIAIDNMEKVIEKLDVPVEHYGGLPVKEEYDDICYAFLKCGTIDMDIPNDIALTKVLYKAAYEHDVKCIMNGHSFRTEGFTPGGWTWMDGKYIEDVHKRFGRKKMHLYPNLWIEDFDTYVVAKIKRFRPIYHVSFDKTMAKQYLNKKFGWEWYGGHHAENKYTKFIGSYMYPIKFGVDLRYVEFSALMSCGQMTREESWKQVHYPPVVETEIIDEVKQRLKLKGEEFEEILNAPVKTYRDYKNYLVEFKMRLPVYWRYVKEGVLPYTFVNRVQNEKLEVKDEISK